MKGGKILWESMYIIQLVSGSNLSSVSFVMWDFWLFLISHHYIWHFYYLGSRICTLGNTTNLIDCLIKDSSVLFFLIWVTNIFCKFTCCVFVFFQAFMQLSSYSFIAIFPIVEVTAGLLKLQIKLCYKCNYVESEILNRLSVKLHA